MHCAHVDLETDTVNTCRLCLSETRMRFEVRIMGLSKNDRVIEVRLALEMTGTKVGEPPMTMLWTDKDLIHTWSPRAWLRACNRTVP